MITHHPVILCVCDFLHCINNSIMWIKLLIPRLSEKVVPSLFPGYPTNPPKTINKKREITKYDIQMMEVEHNSIYLDASSNIVQEGIYYYKIL